MTRQWIPGLTLLLVATACAQRPTPAAEAPTTTDPVLIVASIAKAIDAAPEKADSILTAHQMTMESYEARLTEIASDSASSVRYSAAMR